MQKKISKAMIVGAGLLFAGTVIFGSTLASATPSMGNNCFAAGCHQAGVPPTKNSVVKPPAQKAPAPKPKQAAPAQKTTPAKPKAAPKQAKPAVSPKTATTAPKVQKKPAAAVLLQPDAYIKVTAFGKVNNIGVLIADGTTMVPLRTAADCLKAYLAWDAKEGKITCNYKGQKIILYPAKSKALVDGKELAFKGKIAVKNGTVYLPFELLVELFGRPVTGNVQSDVLFYEGF